ncbi:MAG: GAF domain-containing protein [Planctomycetota bacterium]
MIPLESLTSCFQGIIPAWICTCSKEGIPNAAIISCIDYVDTRHVALSFQFFNKTKRNILENPKAMLRLIHPDTMQAYRLLLRFVRTETDGALFESMFRRIEAIASYSGLKGIFKLLGADVYEVLSVELIAYDAGVPASAGVSVPPAPLDAAVPFTMKALQELSACIHQAPTLDCLLDSILESLERIFGFRYSMILLASDRPDRLELIASRGYQQGGIGSEVGFGEGIIGMVAETHKPIRISGMLRQMLYAYAVAQRAKESGLCPEDRRIPLPGLAHPESQLGIPLLVRDELIGVLCIEGDATYRFHEEDRTYLEVLGGYLAIAIQNALLRERAEEDEPIPPRPHSGRRTKPKTAKTEQSPLDIEFFVSDECILARGEYLVRGLPAKILWKILREQAEGTCEFTNRRLRLDKGLELPVLKDNLESRLILLRRRLEERCPDIRIVQSGRGRFRLELGCEVNLIERP